MATEIYKTRCSVIPKVKTDKGMENDMNAPRDFDSIESAIRGYPSRYTHQEMRDKVILILKSMPDEQLGKRGSKKYLKTELVNGLRNCLQFNHDIAFDGSFVVRAEGVPEIIIGGFYWFTSLIAFAEYLKGQRFERRTFHEIVKPGSFRKAAFDIDATQNKIDEIGVTRDFIFETIAKGIKDAFASSFGINIRDEHLIVCDSSSKTKFSRHILIANYHFTSTEQFVVFQERVPRFIKDEIVPFLDMIATKSAFSSLRLLGCHKRTAPDREKKLISNHRGPDTIIQYIPKDSILLPLLPVRPKGTNDYSFTDEVLEQTMLIINKTFDMESTFSVRNINGTLITIDRNAPSYCILCNRRHEHDSMYVTINGNGVYARCFGFGHQAHIDSEMDEFKLIGRLPWEPAIATAHMIWDDKDVPLSKLIKPLPNAEVYEEEDVKDYDFPPDKDTLLVRSAVGTGKTKSLNRYINSNSPRKIVIVSFRKAFTEEMLGKTKGFLDYRKADTEIDVSVHNRVIIQFESLHRLQSRLTPFEHENGIPDLLVLDEIESIIDQMEHKAMKMNDRLLCNVVMFEHLLKHSKRIIALDAFLSNRSVDLLARTRDLSRIFSHDNLYRARKGNEFILTTHDMLYPIINTRLDEGEHIVIVSNTKKFAKGIYRQLKNKYGDEKKIKIYTGENSCEPEIQEELNNVNEAWKDVDALIYTSTILAGCSFELKHFDTCFGFFTNNTVTTQGCIQMLGRVRDISTKSYIIAFADRVSDGAWFPDDKDFIEQFLCDYYNKVKSKYKEKYGDKNKTLAKRMSEFCGTKTIEVGLDGMVEVQIKKDFYYYTHIDNIVNINANRNYFIARFLNLLKIQGCKLSIDLTFYGKEVDKWIEARDENEKLAHSEFCNDIATVDNPTKKEEKILIDINGVSSHKEFLQVEKIKFARHYGIEFEDIQPDIIMDYGRKNVMRQYLNVKRITVEPTVGASLAFLWDKVSSKTCRDYDSSTMQISLDHRPEKHNLALEAIELCGFPVKTWATPFNPLVTQSRDEVEASVKKNIPSYIEQHRKGLMYYFRKRPKQMENPETWDFRRSMKFLESITMFYGVMVCKPSKKWVHRDTYVAKMNDMFEWNVEKNKLDLYSILAKRPREKKRSAASKYAEMSTSEARGQSFMESLNPIVLVQVDELIAKAAYTDGPDNIGLLTEISKSIPTDTIV
jgi:hypothetical protein